MSGEAFGGNIFKEGELDRNSVYAKNAYTASDGKTYQVAFYNLDVVNRCVAERPRPQVLCVHETGCRRNPPHQIRRVRGGSVIACSSPLPIKNG